MTKSRPELRPEFIMYTAGGGGGGGGGVGGWGGGGGRGYVLTEQNFVRFPKHHTEFLDTPPPPPPPLLTKSQKMTPNPHPVLTRKVKYRQNGGMVER